MGLAWGSRVSADFRRAVGQLCERFAWSKRTHPNWLMACMAFESGETFSPSERNRAGSGAIGLIQFMPRTAEGLGTTTAALAGMTAVEQLHYVGLYFRPYAHCIHALSDMYMAILLPRMIGKPDDAVMFGDGVSYRQNSGLDADADGKVTKAEATHRVMIELQHGLEPGNVYESSAATPDFWLPRDTFAQTGVIHG